MQRYTIVNKTFTVNYRGLKLRTKIEDICEADVDNFNCILAVILLALGIIHATKLRG